MNHSAMPLPCRGPDEARARLDPEEADLGLEVVTDVLRAVVVAQGQAGGGARLTELAAIVVAQ
jgi:hypothetical protein